MRFLIASMNSLTVLIVKFLPVILVRELAPAF
jgi:hypothetical protein